MLKSWTGVRLRNKRLASTQTLPSEAPFDVVSSVGVATKSAAETGTPRRSIWTGALRGARARMTRTPRIALKPSDMELGERDADKICDRFAKEINDQHHLEYVRKMLQLRAAPDAQKAAYMQTYNEDCAPQLTLEEAALERLSKLHAYLRFPKTQIFSLQIKRSLTLSDASLRQAPYAQQYFICDTLIDHAEHLKAHLLWPREEAESQKVETSNASAARVIVLFEGTNLRGRQDLIARLAKVPSGMRANLDAKGIGRRAFARNRERLEAWISLAEAQGRTMTFTGHSLGGALATRTLASLSATRQLQHRLVTFDAPGIDRATALLVAHSASHVLIRTQGDIIPLFGECHPDVAVVTLPSLGKTMAARQLNHVYPQLSDALLHGAALPILNHVDGSARCSPTLEWARKGIGGLSEVWKRMVTKEEAVV